MLTQVHHQTTIAPSRGTFLARLVARLIAADAGFRSREQLRRMTPDQLKDAGLRRRDVAAELPHDPRMGW
ncbi:MAG: DUF1127 domain-containing protein [Proteobacteria bacterium]|nr:DUF1127 domain-containing protein [Pseudomonadota bacterium]